MLMVTFLIYGLIFLDPIKGLKMVKQYVQKQRVIPLYGCFMQDLLR